MQTSKEPKIYCFKHDGSFHRLWTGITLLEENEDFVVVGNNKARVTESDGRYWEAKEPAITIFFPKLWYNVICMIRPTGIHYYCNIASPTKIIDGDIYYIDYDLDIGMSPNNNIRILDEGEYHKHAEQMNYSKELDFVLKKAMYDVIKKCKLREFPFDDNKVNEYYSKYIELTKDKK